jgi:hypothetical protein
MNTMFSAILLSLLAVASADRLKIKNNCDTAVEISSIYFPTGTGIQCYKMQNLAVGDTLVIDNFAHGDDVVLLKSASEPTSGSFLYIASLKRVMGKEEDIGGECSLLVKSGNVGAYSVEPWVPQLNLCKPKPKPSPKPSPSGKCSGVKGGEPFGTDQKAFYSICEPGKTTPTKKRCAKGTLWDTTKGVCNWPRSHKPARKPSHKTRSFGPADN